MCSTCSRIPESSPAIRSTSSSLRWSRASLATWRTWSRSIIDGILGGPLLLPALGDPLVLTLAGALDEGDRRGGGDQPEGGGRRVDDGGGVLLAEVRIGGPV